MDNRTRTTTIASGQTTSPAIEVSQFGSGWIQGPAALTGVVTLQASLDGTNFFPVTSSGSEVTIAAAVITAISSLNAHSLRFVSGGAEGADRTFIFIGGWGNERI